MVGGPYGALGVTTPPDGRVQAGPGACGYQHIGVARHPRGSPNRVVRSCPVDEFRVQVVRCTQSAISDCLPNSIAPTGMHRQQRLGEVKSYGDNDGELSFQVSW